MLLSPPAVHKLFSGLMSQSAKKPLSLSFVLANEPPIERSGTATITLLNPWLCSLSNPKNINARDLPDAGGAFKSKY